MMTSRRSHIRWRALGPLAGFLALLGLAWALMADTVARVSLEEFGTQFLGTQVEVEWLRIHEWRAAVELGGLVIADPFDLDRNLLEVGRIEISLDPEPLLEKKLVIRELVLDQVAIATDRETPAVPVPGGGILSRTANTLAPWRARLDQPFLGFSAADSIRELVLNPDELVSVGAARSLAARADSTRVSFLNDLALLDLEGLVDEGRELTTRIAEADPAQLGFGGTRQLVNDAGAFKGRLDGVEERLVEFEHQAESSLNLLDAGLAELDRARSEDYRRVQAAVGLPGFEGPDIGGMLFGHVSLSYLERALYWVELVRSYMPPGLQPRATLGPHRVRAAGNTVRFPKKGHTPTFLLEAGRLSEADSETGQDHRHVLRLANLTSAPALVGLPAEIHFERTTSGFVDLGLDAVMDHTQAVARDSLHVISRNTALPAIAIPGLPLTADLGLAVNQLHAAIEGDRFSASWTIEAPAVRWIRGGGAGEGDTPDAPLPLEQRIMMEVLTGLSDLRITAELEGTADGLQAFRVRSNVDDAIASRVEALAGDAVRLARQRARAEVDRLSEAVIDTAVARTGLAHTAIEGTVADWRSRLVEVRRQLEEQVRAKTGGLGGMIGMLMPIDDSPSYSK